MTRRLVPLFLIVGALLGWLAWAEYVRPTGVLQDLARVRLQRAFPARLSVPTAYRSCTRVTLPADGTVPREDCGEAADMPLELEHLAAVGESLAPDSLQASALAGVLWWDRQPASLDETIQRLSDALRLASSSVPLRVDLSAVHLFRAQETQNQHDLFTSLNYSRGALAIEPRNRVALFNAALASEALYLDASADAAWSAYLAVDSTSPWADEARGRRRALRERPSVPARPTVSSSVQEVEAYAERYPQEAREQGWHEVLGAWGRAVLADSTARADSLLMLASRLGTALASRPGGDASLADAVEAVRRAGDAPATTATLAAAHSAYAHGQALFNLDAGVAQDSFTRVLELKPSSPVLVAWARAFGAGAKVYLRTGGLPDAWYRTLLADVDTLRYPALTARIHWTRGKVLFGPGKWADAQEHYARAAQMYQRLGEMENYGAVRPLEGWARYEQGDTLAGYRMAHQAALALRPYRRSLRLRNLMRDLAEYAARDEMPSTALVLQDEDVAVAGQLLSTVPNSLPDALQSRARFHLVNGDTGRADADLDSAAVLYQALNDSNKVAFLTHTRALIGNRPAAEVDSAVAYFSRDNNNQLWWMVALVRRADLRLARRGWQGAGADLDSITAYIERASESGTDYHFRSALVEQARSRLDQLVMLHVGAGRQREALRALERGRVSFVPGMESRHSVGDRLSGPEGQVVLEYALIGDTLLAWTVRGDSVALDPSVVNRDSLVFAVERVGRALEAGREDVALPLLERLHEWLISPVLGRLPASAPLVIVADGEIGRVPFAVLRNPQTGRDLVESHTLSSAASLADAGRREPGAKRSAPRALLVADPEFDPREHPALTALSGAHEEMKALRGIYPGADTLSGSNASIGALRSRLRTADMLHYAGHAVFDDARPERSFLVLAGAERLPADTISRWDLRGVRLVVLSACSTIRARHGRSGGFSGLSGAFLSAGAGGVVGSLWKVNDRHTQLLMEAFHREYQASGDPAAALSKAQREMRRKEHSPAVWAGFRYVGG